MSEQFLAGLLAGYGVAIPVGAIAVLIMSVAARTSPRVGYAAALGAATADGIFAAIAVATGAAAAGLIAPIARVMTWIAAIVLTAMAVISAMRAWSHRAGTPAAAKTRTGLATARNAFAGLLLLTLLNPLTVVYFAMLVLGGISHGVLTAADRIVFVVGAFLASASWQMLVATGGAVVGRVLTGARGRLLTALGSSALIAFLAVRLLLPA